MWLKTEKSVETTPSTIGVDVREGKDPFHVWLNQTEIVMTLTHDEANCLHAKLGQALEEYSRVNIQGGKRGD